MRATVAELGPWVMPFSATFFIPSRSYSRSENELASMKKSHLILCLAALISCSQPLPGNETNPIVENNGGTGEDTSLSPLSSSNPFEDHDLGDNFAWGAFIRGAFQTTTVKSLPMPVYLVYFNEEEEKIIEEGIEMANDAIGFDVFEIVDEWSSTVRVIYKVSKVEFPGSKEAGTLSNRVVGYTYCRNVYRNGLYDAGRVVTDWAMELKAGSITKWVVAHELGHAMGIQKHDLIDYENDTVEALEPNSLMGPTVGINPELGDYEYMMQEQGNILLEFMDLN